MDPMARYKHLIFLGLGMVVTLAAYLWFLQSPYFERFTDWSTAHVSLLFIVLAAIKTIGIIWPPIPGGILTFGAIPVIGWERAYLADLLGSLIGSSVAFWIARRWGMRFIENILDAETIRKIRRVKIAPKREFEALFIFRLFGGTVVEIICYAAGLLGVRYRNFLPAIFLSHIAVGVPFYYLGGGLFGEHVWISTLLFLALILVFWRLRTRYFVIEE